MALELNDKNFEDKILKGDKIALVDFWAPWCGPCQMMSSIIEETAKEIGGKAVVGKLNVDESPETAQKYGVMSIPTVIIFKNGEIAKQIVGVQSKEVLLDELKNA
ncbi:MAG: thioredoxin [Patescibacteria group bacterium]|nr:thioredoxin [Patescibacteria group bacterium]